MVIHSRASIVAAARLQKYRDHYLPIVRTTSPVVKGWEGFPSQNINYTGSRVRSKCSTTSKNRVTPYLGDHIFEFVQQLGSAAPRTWVIFSVTQKTCGSVIVMIAFLAKSLCCCTYSIAHVFPIPYYTFCALIVPIGGGFRRTTSYNHLDRILGLITSLQRPRLRTPQEVNSLLLRCWKQTSILCLSRHRYIHAEVWTTALGTPYALRHSRLYLCSSVLQNMFHELNNVFLRHRELFLR